MNPRRAPLVVLPVVLLLAALSLVVPVTTSNERAPGAVAVPIGHIGDRVEYARFERSSASEAWRPAEGRSFVVNSTASSPDKVGVFHETIVLEWAALRDNITFYDGYLPSRSFVDLTTRHVLRNENMARCGPECRGADWYDAMSDLGPRLQAGWFGGNELGDLAFQGFGFGVGEELNETFLSLFADLWGLRDDGVGPPRIEGTVTAGGIVDGHDARAIRIQGTVQFDLNVSDDFDEYWIESDGMTPFLSFLVPLKSRVEFVRTVWVSSDVPYPLAYEDDLTVNGSSRRLGQSRLVNYSAGHEEIPWGRDSALPHYFEANPNLERTPGVQDHPGDGSASRLRYPLSQALLRVETDPALVDVRAWRLAHPDSRLVSATLNPCFVRRCQPDAETWELFFAEPSGQAYWVETRKPHDPAMPVVDRHGPSAVLVPQGSGAAFEDGDFVRNPATIAALEQVWLRAASPEYVSKPQNYVRWGFPLAILGGVPRGAYFQAFSRPETLQTLTFGVDSQEDSSPINPQAAVGGPPGRENGSRMTMNLATGQILALGEWEGEGWEHRLLPQVGNPAPVIPYPAKANALSTAPVTIQRGSLLATSLVAVFLAVYFYPLLKFFGTQFLGLVPGYAKLHKETILSNRTREQLLEGVRAEPGVTPPELQRAVQAGWSTVVYHLRVLEKNDLVSSLIDGRHKRFFPVGEIDHSKRGQIAALRNARTKAMFDLITEEPGVVQKDLARRLGITVPTAIWHVRRLEQARLVGSDRFDRKVHYYAQAGPGRAYDAKAAVEVT